MQGRKIVKLPSGFYKVESDGEPWGIIFTFMWFVTSLPAWEWIIETINRCSWGDGFLSKDGLLCSKVRTFINVEDLDFGTNFETVLILQTPLILFWGIYWIKRKVSKNELWRQRQKDEEDIMQKIELLVAQKEECKSPAEQLRLLDKFFMEEMEEIARQKRLEGETDK